MNTFIQEPINDPDAAQKQRDAETKEFRSDVMWLLYAILIIVIIN